MRHGGLISSNGFIATNESNEVIVFEYPLNALLIETLGDELRIQINDKDNLVEENLWVISPEDRIAIEGVRINSITIHGEAGQALKWTGLIE